MPFFIYDGKYFSESEPVIHASSRALRYGDGLFETMKLRNGNIIFPSEHFMRLWKGMELLQFHVPKLWNKERLLKEAGELAAKNGLTDARIRLTVIRGEGGIFEAIEKDPHYILEATALPEKNILNTNGLQLCIYRDAAKTIDRFSNLKHNNCLPYLMGAVFAKEQHCNEALILNSKGNICESTIANAFFIKDSIINTPALSEGCIAGVMRNWLIEKIQEIGFTVNETTISTEDALAADEIFLSNSVQNCRWVAAIDDKQYSNTVITSIAKMLNEKYPDVF